MERRVRETGRTHGLETFVRGNAAVRDMKSTLPLETDGYSSWNRAGASPPDPRDDRFRVSEKGNAYIPSIEIKAIEWAVCCASTILELP